MKRAALLFLIFILVGFVFVPPARAQFNPVPSAQEFGAIVDQKTKEGQMSKEVYTVNTQAAYMDTAICMITGCADDPTSAFYFGKSAVASIGNTVTAMYSNPPADLSLWIKDTGQTLGFFPHQVNAQGIGFSGLSPLLPIWKAFRNIAYALLAIVMIVIGFMVMFRKKIDPKTVVTVQNALPKIVLTLLLITFSYAIVGFMIDLMYLIIGLVAAILVPVSNGLLGADTASKYMDGAWWNLFATVFNGTYGVMHSIVTLVTPQIGLGGADRVIGQVFALPIDPLFLLILSIIVIISYIRILFMLVAAYVQIIISVLISPLQILTEALPGSNGFSSWFKNLFANLSIFPVTAAMLMIGTILSSFDLPSNSTAQNPGTLWTPPLLSGGGIKAVVGFIGLGLLMTIPNMAKAIKEALKTKPLLGGGTGMGAVGGLAMQGFSIGSSIIGMNNQKQSAQNLSVLAGAVKSGQQGTTGAINNLAQSLQNASKGSGGGGG